MNSCTKIENWLFAMHSFSSVYSSTRNEQMGRKKMNIRTTLTIVWQPSQLKLEWNGGVEASAHAQQAATINVRELHRDDDDAKFIFAWRVGVEWSASWTVEYTVHWIWSENSRAAGRAQNTALLLSSPCYTFGQGCWRVQNVRKSTCELTDQHTRIHTNYRTDEFVATLVLAQFSPYSRIVRIVDVCCEENKMWCIKIYICVWTRTLYI